MELETPPPSANGSRRHSEDLTRRTANAQLKNPDDYVGPDSTVIDLEQTPRGNGSASARLAPWRDKFLAQLPEMQTEIASLLQQHQRDAHQIQTSPPPADSFWQGAVTGGFLAYVLSFYAAKIATLGLSEVCGKQADWAFAPLAGVLHATAGEAIGGGVRATFATYQSPDGALWANLVSALSDCLLYTVGGHAKRRRRAWQHFDQAIAAIHTSLDKRLGPDPKRWSSLAAFGALWRSVVCDEVAFFAFAIAYVGSGSARPTLRRLDNRALSLGGEFGVVLACGLAGGLFTSAIQNLLRRCVQRGEHASGHNDALTRRAKLALIDETCRALKRKGELVKMCWQKHLREAATSTLVLRGEDRQALDEMEQQVKALLGSVDQALRDFQQEVARLEAQEGCAATCTAIGDTTSRMFCAPAVQSTPWVGRAAKWRRLLAKSIGNTAVVASYLYYVNEVANVMYPLHRDSPLNQTGMPQPDALPGHAPYPPIESGEMAAYAMHGFVLIGAWCTRSVLNTATELGALSVVPGLGLRLGTTATAIWKWARSAQAVAPAGDGGGAAPAPTGTADEDEDGDAGSSSSTSSTSSSSSSSTVGAADDGNGASPSPTHITTINGLIEPSEDDEDDEDEVDKDDEQDGASTPGALQAAIRDVGQAVQDTRLILNVVRMPSDTDTDTVSGSDD